MKYTAQNAYEEFKKEKSKEFTLEELYDFYETIEERLECFRQEVDEIFIYNEESMGLKYCNMELTLSDEEILDSMLNIDEYYEEYIQYLRDTLDCQLDIEAERERDSNAIEINEKYKEEIRTINESDTLLFIKDKDELNSLLRKAEDEINSKINNKYDDEIKLDYIDLIKSYENQYFDFTKMEINIINCIFRYIDYDILSNFASRLREEDKLFKLFENFKRNKKLNQILN